MKKLISIILILSFSLMLCSCRQNNEPVPAESGNKEESAVTETNTGSETLYNPETEAHKVDKGPETSKAANIYVLSGPTGIGALPLWERAENGETDTRYHFTLSGSNDEIIAAISKGEADIAAVATNLASVLYNKTNGGVMALAINTTGVLSILSNGTPIVSVRDLAGKTIYSPGHGANPEYILRYLLVKNGLDPDFDVNICFVSEGSELLQVWTGDPDAYILAPQPVATTLLVQNENAKIDLNLTEEWEMVSTDGSALVMGCVIARTEFVENNPEVVTAFLDDYKISIEQARSDSTGTAELCEKYGIIPKAAIAMKALPYCGLTFITGLELKEQLSGYLQVMYDANPASIGGQLPSDPFYYETK